LVFGEFFGELDFGDDVHVSGRREETFVAKSLLGDSDLVGDLGSFGDLDGDCS
jgi:hypothetical protein